LGQRVAELPGYEFQTMIPCHAVPGDDRHGRPARAWTG